MGVVGSNKVFCVCYSFLFLSVAGVPLFPPICNLVYGTVTILHFLGFGTRHFLGEGESVPQTCICYFPSVTRDFWLQLSHAGLSSLTQSVSGPPLFTCHTTLRAAWGFFPRCLDHSLSRGMSSAATQATTSSSCP